VQIHSDEVVALVEPRLVQRVARQHLVLASATALVVVSSGPAQPLLVPVLVVVECLEQGSMVRLQRRRQRDPQLPHALVRPRRERARDCLHVVHFSGPLDVPEVAPVELDRI